MRCAHNTFIIFVHGTNWTLHIQRWFNPDDQQLVLFQFIFLHSAVIARNRSKSINHQLNLNNKNERTCLAIERAKPESQSKREKFCCSSFSFRQREWHTGEQARTYICAYSTRKPGWIWCVCTNGSRSSRFKECVWLRKRDRAATINMTRHIRHSCWWSTPPPIFFVFVIHLAKRAKSSQTKSGRTTGRNGDRYETSLSCHYNCSNSCSCECERARALTTRG